MKRFLRKIVNSLLIGSIIIIFVLFFLNNIFPLPSFKLFSLSIEGRNGNYLQAYLADDGKWRMRTSPEEIPSKLKHILIKKEDKYFYYHFGINPFSIVRASYQNFVSGKRISSASTLTMQVARMLEQKPRKYVNKLIEMFRAIQLELKYSKRKILEMYLSLIPLGGNIEGIKSAALIYYQTPPERLNIAQLFDLILIPNDPNNLRLDRFRERLFEERQKRALLWIRKCFLSKEDAIIIWQTDTTAIRQSLPQYAPHFCLRVEEEIKNRYEVKYSLDLNIQKNVESLLSNYLQKWRQKGVQNGAVLIVDNQTKRIVTYIGSENFNETKECGQVDVVKVLRSPGSTLKPFLFTFQVDKGMLTTKTRLLDTPVVA